jgi:pyrroline-5-carboxylate reductase
MSAMKLGFIGTGEIACAIVKGLCTSSMTDLAVNLSPRNEENSRALAETFENVTRLESNQLVLDQSDTVFIAVRPSDAENVLSRLKFRVDHKVISLVPFLSLSELATAVEPAQTLSRAIPLPTVVNHDCPIPLFNSNTTVASIFSHIGQPLLVDDENQLHVLWTLTGLIAPYYDLLGELSGWAASHGVEGTIANQYVADMFHSLSLSAQKTSPIDFNELVKHATTPNGMNEQAGKEIRQQGAHETYKTTADHLLKRFLEHF